MKKKYIKPAISVYDANFEHALLAGSPEKGIMPGTGDDEVDGEGYYNPAAPMRPSGLWDE